MKLQLLSDLHFEFHRDKGASFVNSLNPEGVDVLVLAGDLAVGEALPAALDLFCERYASAQILYVHGNHEFYGTNRSLVTRLTRKAAAKHENLHWLDGHVVEIEGQRFLGAPLWFRYDRKASGYEGQLNDFRAIYDYRNWVYEENKRAIGFLSHETQEGDVVITHHLPSPASIHPRYKGSPLNAFFLCDLTELIQEKRPAVWMHGHTHTSVDRVLSCGTRLLCNPFGYVGHEVNPAFQDLLVLDL